MKQNEAVQMIKDILYIIEMFGTEYNVRDGENNKYGCVAIRDDHIHETIERYAKIFYSDEALIEQFKKAFNYARN